MTPAAAVSTSPAMSEEWWPADDESLPLTVVLALKTPRGSICGISRGSAGLGHPTARQHREGPLGSRDGLNRDGLRSREAPTDPGTG